MGRRDDGPTEYTRHRATKRRKKNKKKNKNKEGGRVDGRVEVDDRREEEEGVGTSDSNYLELRADDPPGSVPGFSCARRARFRSVLLCSLQLIDHVQA